MRFLVDKVSILIVVDCFGARRALPPQVKQKFADALQIALELWACSVT